MGKKTLAATMATLILGFYIAIILFVMLEFLDIDAVENFATALTFEIIGFLLLGYFVIGNIVCKPLKTGFFIPLVMVTIIYTIVVNVVNLHCVFTMSHTGFVLLDMIVLFVYCLIAAPMYVVGRKTVD